jgi:hypothetical protein
MAQKILVALDDSDNALRCVELAAKTFSTDNTISKDISVLMAN